MFVKLIVVYMAKHSTKVGVSYDDHMNDDAPEVDSFTRKCYQALSSPSMYFVNRETLDVKMINSLRMRAD